MMGLWDCSENDHADDSIHASLRFGDVESSGPPSRPLDFPTPRVFRCEKVDIKARDHRSGTIYELKNVIMRSELDSFGRQAHAAYLVKKKLTKSVYGSVRLCIVLKRCSREGTDQAKESREEPIAGSDDFDDVEWESTDLQAVIKASSWSKIHALRGRHLEDPIKEVAAMQHLGNYHPHVLGALEVLQDDEFLYTVMHYLPGGDLYGRVLGSNLAQSPTTLMFDPQPCGISESQAREWFRQLLLALFHLQKKGVCHRDISLENLMLDELDQVVLIDPGMCLRVPYTDPSNPGCAAVTDVSGGGSRRLISAQGQGGKLMYLAPEVYQGDEAFDGFATDLWAAGVVLFVILVGLSPFEFAHSSDKRFEKISKGGLKSLIEANKIPLSSDACDLLQGMLWKDPRKRYTLSEVTEHPWVVGTSSTTIAKAVPRSPKSMTRRKLQSRSHHKARVASSPKVQQKCEKQKRQSYLRGVGGTPADSRF